MSRPQTNSTDAGARRGNEACRAACNLASTARRAGRTDLQIMGDRAAGKLKHLARKVATTTDPTGTRRDPDRIPMSDPRCNLADVTLRLRKALRAADRGDWTLAEIHAEKALDVLGVGWIASAKRAA